MTTLPGQQVPGPAGEESRGEPEQLTLLAAGEWWEESWKGMPEFIQEDQEPLKTIHVHFESRKDVEAFAALLGQAITMNTRALWYPEAEIGHFANKRYIEATQEPDGEPGSLEEEVEFRSPVIPSTLFQRGGGSRA